MRSILCTLVLAFFSALALAEFEYEYDTLSQEHIARYAGASIHFASSRTTHRRAAEILIQKKCRAFPGSNDWPSNDQWRLLNESIDGLLLKPTPIGAACYNGPLHDEQKCQSLINQAPNERFYIDNPLTILTQWPQGRTCVVDANPEGNCTQGGFPEFVVNASTVRHVQSAVNFARNNNVRLVMRNSGHDFIGRSAGAGALSIFIHSFKGFEFLQDYSVGQYKGMAARVGTSLEAWEMYDYMKKYNISLVVPAGYTVAPYGGWFQGGGHSNLASYLGMGSDQILSLNVVTADGKIVNASPEENTDLFWAMRGGGPGTYGIVISAVVKAHPPVSVLATTIAFSTTTSTTVEPFWRSIGYYYNFGKKVCAAGGTAYGDTTFQSKNNFTFSGEFEFPGKSASEITTILEELFKQVRGEGFSVTVQEPKASTRWAPGSRGKGDIPGDFRFGSRLFPQQNWDNIFLFANTMASIRATVEAGYLFHGIHMAPRTNIAGYPGIDSAVNPAFRNTLMHRDIVDNSPMRGMSVQTIKDGFAKLQNVMNKIRAATPGGGAYVNESDPLEPNWQVSLYGINYPRLLQIKRKWDPEAVFYARTTVGSEAWEVKTADGLPTQNGKLCMV